MEIIKTDAVIDIPEDVAICPYCNSKLYAQFTGWQEQNDGSWAADEVALECESEPDIDADEFDDWADQHTVMPYVYWLPVSEKVKKWINSNYRFDME